MKCKLIYDTIVRMIMAFRRYKWFFFLLMISITAIYIIKLTEFRPLGSAEKYEEINSIIINLSYSYIAAAIFHTVMIIYPELRRRKIMRGKIESYFLRIKTAMTFCITHMHPYSFDPKDYRIRPKEEFIEEFSRTDLTSPCDYLNILKRIASEINLSIEFLLNIQEFLSDEEIEKIINIKDSLFLKEAICPTSYIENDDGSLCEISGSNQKKMAESIYNIYELINDLVCK